MSYALSAATSCCCLPRGRRPPAAAPPRRAAPARRGVPPLVPPLLLALRPSDCRPNTNRAASAAAGAGSVNDGAGAEWGGLPPPATGNGAASSPPAASAAANDASAVKRPGTPRGREGADPSGGSSSTSSANGAPEVATAGEGAPSNGGSGGGASGSGAGSAASAGAAAAQTPHAQPRGAVIQELASRLDGLAAKYQQLDDRLDALERALVEIYKQRRRTTRNPQAATDPSAPGGSGGDAVGVAVGVGVAPIGGSSGKTAAGRGGSSSAAGAAGASPPAGQPPAATAGEGSGGPSVDGEGADVGEDGEGAVGGLVFDISKLQSSVVETLNSGHLESIKTLRETLMAHEWELHAKRLAMHRGVANFEHYAGLQKLDVDYNAVTKLYQDPSDLSVLPNNQLRLMARSMIEQAVDERYLEVYAQCTTVARDLANMNMTSRLPIPVPGAGAMSGVAGVVRSIAGGLLGKQRP